MRVRLFAALLAAGMVTLVANSPASQAATLPTTSSYYEYNVDPNVLYAQGATAGRASSQGLVILDFGRPAYDGASHGTINYSNQFVSLASIETAVESYIKGYFDLAPSYTQLSVAVGTNNSCGTGQPCGDIVCGCSYEPPDFFAWGRLLAATVMQIQSWTNSWKASHRFTDVVKVIAADDVEPAYDPGYRNTHDVLAGYAQAVGGYQPAMVDYGSAESGYWSQDQLLEAANGFRPNVAGPEIYYPSDARNWSALAAYAKSKYGVVVTFFGVLTEFPVANSPQAAHDQMVNAIRPVTGQADILWSTNIAPLRQVPGVAMNQTRTAP
jgi:hypothetical protein